MIHWPLLPLLGSHTTTIARAGNAKQPSGSGKASPSSTDPSVAAVGVSSPALIPVLDPEEWDCPPLWDMPEWQQRKRRKVQLRDLPQLTGDEASAWNRILRDVFARDEEWALRYAMSHLIHSWAVNNPMQECKALKSENRTDTINRRGLKRAEWEQMFRTWGDILTNIDDVGDVGSGASLLAEVTEFLAELPTQAEKRLLVMAAESSPFWGLVKMLADKAEEGGEDPEYVKQAYVWMDAWESLRRGLDISKGT